MFNCLFHDIAHVYHVVPAENVTLSTSSWYLSLIDDTNHDKKDKYIKVAWIVARGSLRAFVN